MEGEPMKVFIDLSQNVSFSGSVGQLNGWMTAPVCLTFRLPYIHPL